MLSPEYVAVKEIAAGHWVPSEASRVVLPPGSVGSRNLRTPEVDSLFKNSIKESPVKSN